MRVADGRVTADAASDEASAIAGSVCGVLAVTGALLGVAYKKQAGPFAPSAAGNTASAQAVEGKVGNPLQKDAQVAGDDEQTDVL